MVDKDSYFLQKSKLDLTVSGLLRAAVRPSQRNSISWFRLAASFPNGKYRPEAEVSEIYLNGR